MADQNKDYNGLKRLRSLLSKSSLTISGNNVEALNDILLYGNPVAYYHNHEALKNTTNFYFYHKLSFA